MRTNTRRPFALLAVCVTIWALAVPVTAIARLESGDLPPTGTRIDPRKVPVGSDDALYAAPTSFDRIGRIVAPVMINGQGPFRFIVDTGASRSAISPVLAQRLGLVTSAGSTLTVHGVTGSGSVPYVTVDRMQVGEIVLENRRLPVIIPTVFADADGILGVEGLTDAYIFVDFLRDRIEISRARSSHPRNDWSRVPVRLRFGQLMVADARVGKVRVKAVIDTGAERTLGNLALRKALGLDSAAIASDTERKVFGATEETKQGNTIPAPVISLGDAGIRRLAVTFADLDVFRLWNLEDTPALVLGMDVLGSISAIVFDYHRRELLIRP